MKDFLDRSRRLIGEAAVCRLKQSRVALFGLGGVGSAALEALCRAGIGHIALFDGDSVNLSNINRQLIATQHTVGQSKTSAAAERARSINPEIELEQYCVFYTPQNADEFDLSKYDYIIDAIDTVSSKIELAVRAKELSVPIISCMGTGNKLDASKFEVSDIYKTSVCPLCRVMRRELSKRGVDKLKVVYSKQPPITPKDEDKRSPASISFVPPVAGMILAGEVILDIIK